MKLKPALIATILTLCASGAQAWDDQGHMMVAAVAWDHLSASTRVKVTALLKLNPDYQTWITGAAPDAVDQIAFVEAATWPDAIKGESGYTNDGDKPTDPNAARNIGYADKLQHRYWHFIDTPFSTDGTALIAPVPPNAQTQIEAFRTVLSSPDAADDLKSYDLAWILHLVGDIHQPLHATSRFTATQTTGDEGGNLVKIKQGGGNFLPFLARHGSSATVLHAYWDDVLGTSKSAAVAITAAAALPDVAIDQGAIADDAVWIQESFQAAQQTAYARPIGPGAGPYALSTTYKANAKALAQGRVALAGVRLANLLNAAMP
jgi:hypothetical protein